MSRPKPGTRSSHTTRYLARTIARRCHGRTLVLGRGLAGLMSALGSRGVEASARSFESLTSDQEPQAPPDERTGDDARGSFDTVVLVRAIEFTEPERAEELLRRAWQLLEPHGELLVCAPNERHVDEPGAQQRFTKRSLKKLLKSLDWPRVFTEQPLAWLFMSVRSGPYVNRPTSRRHRVIAGLCRGRVLELGCGSGELSAKIAQRGHAVLGVDRNAAKIAKARRLYPAIDFDQGDIFELPDHLGHDTVVLAEVLEHVPESEGNRMLHRAWDLVRPGGRLVVSVPNEDCVKHVNHLREFTQADLVELLKPLGRPRLVADQPFKWLLAYVDRLE